MKCESQTWDQHIMNASSLNRVLFTITDTKHVKSISYKVIILSTMSKMHFYDWNLELLRDLSQYRRNLQVLVRTVGPSTSRPTPNLHVHVEVPPSTTSLLLKLEASKFTTSQPLTVWKFLIENDVTNCVRSAANRINVFIFGRVRLAIFCFQ